MYNRCVVLCERDMCARVRVFAIYMHAVSRPPPHHTLYTSSYVLRLSFYTYTPPFAATIRNRGPHTASSRALSLCACTPRVSVVYYAMLITKAIYIPSSTYKSIRRYPLLKHDERVHDARRIHAQ